jgi:hypothetical protein
MLVLGNSKLGKIYNWSLPAGDTCPGKTDTCFDDCYARSGTYRFGNVRLAHSRNLAFSQRPEFVGRMAAYIKAFAIRLIRIHAAGDFYDAAYTDKWYQIASQSHDTVLYCYSRSWHDTDRSLQDALMRLGNLPNVRLWLSVDRDTGRPGPGWNFPLAWMAIDDQDIPDYRPDLVFRTDRTTYQKRQHGTGALVCPLEQGLDTINASCETCRLCFDPSRGLLGGAKQRRQSGELAIG